MSNYHVLSNDDIITIIIYSLIAAIFLAFEFAKLGGRDPIPSYKKGLVAKIIPWAILLLFLSGTALIISRLATYPWDIEPQPSNASAYRELRYLGSGHPIWGWANDYQLSVVGLIGGCIAALCWTVYAFAFKRSNTKWWKKMFKVLAYILLSVLIIGFTFHEWKDIYAIAMFLAPIVLFLGLSHVKPNKNNKPDAPGLIPVEPGEQKTIAPETTSQIPIKENDELFMPKNVEDELNKAEVVNVPEIDLGCATEKVKVNNENVRDTGILLHSEKSQSTVDSDDRHDSQEHNTIIVDEMIEIPSKNDVSIEEPTTIESMFCKYCGNQIELDSTFCKYCGKKL